MKNCEVCRLENVNCPTLYKLYLISNKYVKLLQYVKLFLKKFDPQFKLKVGEP